ncbi:ribonuclease H-like domain-containing protein [Tanacetum coccineum]
MSPDKEPIATSVIVSGGYEDDEDSGDVIMYTRLDGQDKNSKLHVVDQKPEGGNLGMERIPPPYTGNFMPPTPDFKEEPKVVKKNDDAPIIKEWVSNDEEEDVSQLKTEKKIVRPSIVKKEFVKSKQQEKTARKIVEQVEQHRKNTHSPRGNQRN